MGFELGSVALGLGSVALGSVALGLGSVALGLGLGLGLGSELGQGCSTTYNRMHSTTRGLCYDLVINISNILNQQDIVVKIMSQYPSDDVKANIDTKKRLH